MEKISQSHFDKSDLITVSCPQCSKSLFTFSRNILENDGAFSLAVQIALPWYTSAIPGLNTKSSFSACKSNLLFGGYFYDKHGKSLWFG